jgi:hypothetical protein
MESTLLPMAERLRHRRHEDTGCIFSSHSAMMLCRCQGASQVCSSTRRRPSLLIPSPANCTALGWHPSPPDQASCFHMHFLVHINSYTLAEKDSFVPDNFHYKFHYKRLSKDWPLLQQNAAPPDSSQGTSVRLRDLCCLCLCVHAPRVSSWELTARSGRSLGSSACIWLSSPSRSVLSLGSSSGSGTYSRAAFSVAPRE